MLLQDLWLLKIGWDDDLPAPIANKWTQMRNEFPDLANVHIPRWLRPQKHSQVQLHGFSDASQLAMAAAVYLRVSEDAQQSTRVMLVCAKTKVAPLKQMAIPRLELTAAWMLSKLMRHVQRLLEFHDAPVYLWTDSAVALTWILSPPSRWKEFVRNRVTAIQELTSLAHWQFVPGKQNPADCASRGLSPEKLSSFSLWWNGPKWLAAPEGHWPAHQLQLSSAAFRVERPGVLLHVIKPPEEDTHPLWYFLSRFSSASRLFRVTATCFRCCARFQKLPSFSLSPWLTPDEIDAARIIWVKIIQGLHFSTEMKALQDGLQLPATHYTSRLTAFIDHQGILRVGRRLKHSRLDPEAKHPIILPRRSYFTTLLIAQAHIETLHGGTQLTLSQLRHSYWILGGRASIRSHVLKCVRCARHRGQRAQQLMGQLPETRVTPARPFSITGVDYAGPLTLKTFQGRGAKTYKGWICVFVYFTTSAVQLEAVTDYSAETFLKAYRRFTSRRGVYSKLYSDCGTTFKGANTLLKSLFSSCSPNHQLISKLANEGTQWLFLPPGAPHFGGKWEAAVKSVKYHLQRTIGPSLVTFEDLSTLLAQVEAVLNTRRLTPLSDDPEDLAVLTPASFLTGSAYNLIPEPQLPEENQLQLTNWKLIQQKRQYFWRRSSAECLQRYQSISKWHHPAHNIMVGSTVLLSGETTPPASWPLARVIALHPGSDNLTRVVTLKTATTILKRPIAKLILLPVAHRTIIQQHCR